jgi:hypothetical protein
VFALSVAAAVYARVAAASETTARHDNAVGWGVAVQASARISAAAAAAAAVAQPVVGVASFASDAEVELLREK